MIPQEPGHRIAVRAEDGAIHPAPKTRAERRRRWFSGKRLLPGRGLQERCHALLFGSPEMLKNLQKAPQAETPGRGFMLMKSDEFQYSEYGFRKNVSVWRWLAG